MGSSLAERDGDANEGGGESSDKAVVVDDNDEAELAEQ
jgi:hypothetical protein